MRAYVAAVALGLAACGPSVPGFDGGFDELDLEAGDDAVAPDTGPITCSVVGNHCDGNSECCSNQCSLGNHTCS